MVAEHSQQKFPASIRSRELDASAIHGPTGRSGCTPAEPYPPSRRIHVNPMINIFKLPPVDKPHTRDFVGVGGREASGVRGIPAFPSNINHQPSTCPTKTPKQRRLLTRLPKRLAPTPPRHPSPPRGPLTLTLQSPGPLRVDDKSIAELAASIVQKGIVEPLVIRKTPASDQR